jgi:hypothetical protein
VIERQDPQDTVTAVQAVVWTETAQLDGVLSKRLWFRRMGPWRRDQFTTEAAVRPVEGTSPVGYR